jgi:hypothetical protein
VSAHKKGRICFLENWELEEIQRGSQPNCRNHRHISKADAFELTGDRYYGKTLAPIVPETGGNPCGWFVVVGKRIEFTITDNECEFPFEQVRTKGLELERKLGIPFIERKVPVRARAG